MSYDVRFMAKLEGISEYAEVINCDANITWNVKELIKHSVKIANTTQRQF
jgi:hypothetical protein